MPGPHPAGIAYAVWTPDGTSYTRSRDAAIAEGRRLRGLGFAVRVGGCAVSHGSDGREHIVRVEIDLDAS
jgi:hypothetical protein